MILTAAGSEVYGTTVDGLGDRDEMGLCFEPPSVVLGLEPFDQHQWRSKPEGERSGPGDLDLTIYGLRKWMRLAVKGNPSILLLLFTPNDRCLTNPLGDQVRAEVPALVRSRSAGKQFLGYLTAQRDRALGLRGGAHVNRPELIEKYGFDTKYAMHMVRLGVMGVEYLKEGTMHLPMQQPMRSWLLDLRQGKVPLEEAIAAANELEAELESLIFNDRSELPWEPSRAAISDWMVDFYRKAWSW